MIVLCARTDDPTFKKWCMVDNIIRRNLSPEEKERWNKRGHGYEWLSIDPNVLEHFGITKIYRGGDSYMRYKFTDEQWTMFLLKWTA